MDWVSATRQGGIKGFLTRAQVALRAARCAAPHSGSCNLRGTRPRRRRPPPAPAVGCGVGRVEPSHFGAQRAAVVRCDVRRRVSTRALDSRTVFVVTAHARCGLSLSSLFRTWAKRKGPGNSFRIFRAEIVEGCEGSAGWGQQLEQGCQHDGYCLCALVNRER